MAKRHYLRFLIRKEPKDLIFEVRASESDRLAENLGSMTEFKDQFRFFWFDTVDGKSVIINLMGVQAARCLWDVSNGPADLVRYEGSVQIKLRGLSEPIEGNSEEAEGIYDLFTYLEMGEDAGTFHSFEDRDGEPIFLNAKEVVWIIAPTHIVEEGRRIISESNDLED